MVDDQVPRLAYTLNEAICPRNKWVVGFQGNKRRYRYVKAGQVRNSSNVILGTEWNPNWRIVADKGRSSPDDNVCKSHRPVHGFIDLGGSDANIDQISADAFGSRPTYRQVRANDLANDPQPGGASSTRLDWVGRNHGKKKLQAGFDVRRSNFLYVDGHVETKSVRDTVRPGSEWGEAFWSLDPHHDIARN